MAKINIIHDTIGNTLTIYFGDPNKESLSELTDDEIILMKDVDGNIIGAEFIHLNVGPDDDIEIQKIS